MRQSSPTNPERLNIYHSTRIRPKYQRGKYNKTPRSLSTSNKKLTSKSKSRSKSKSKTPSVGLFSGCCFQSQKTISLHNNIEIASNQQIHSSMQQSTITTTNPMIRIPTSVTEPAESTLEMNSTFNSSSNHTNNTRNNSSSSHSTSNSVNSYLFALYLTIEITFLSLL